MSDQIINLLKSQIYGIDIECDHLIVGWAKDAII